MVEPKAAYLVSYWNGDADYSYTGDLTQTMYKVDMIRSVM